MFRRQVAQSCETCEKLAKTTNSATCPLLKGENISDLKIFIEWRSLPPQECEWHASGPHGRHGPARPDRGQESNLHVDAGTPNQISFMG